LVHPHPFEMDIFKKSWKVLNQNPAFLLTLMNNTWSTIVLVFST
jgi:hypothetical protein